VICDQKKISEEIDVTALYYMLLNKMNEEKSVGVQKKKSREAKDTFSVK